MRNTGDSVSSEPEPNYNVTLDFNYQDFVSYLYMGNRIENFTAYFNTFFESNKLFNEAFDEYRSSLISVFNRKLDSLGISPPVSSSVKDKLDKAIERSSKIIQFHKNSKFIDDAVLIIGKSYYLLTDYYKAERTFNEFLSKFSSSVLADEAILYLGRTKVKLDKTAEGEKIFKNLFQNSSSSEIKSLAARDLGILAYNNKKFDEAIEYFKASIDFSSDNERKAEGEFILAKILSGYKPELAANEYKKVLDYTSDYDLSFYARLNYAKGLLFNKDYRNADDELASLRKKYRDDPAFTQLIDLEMANSLYAQNKIREAKDKYFEVIVKYPSTPSSADAYYYLAKYDEDVQYDYLNALVNFKKSLDENGSSDFHKEAQLKATTLERYFTLLENVRQDTTKLEIPTANAEVEKFRKIYNEEKGLEQQQQQEQSKQGFENNKGDDGKSGDGKGKPGGLKGIESPPADSMKGNENTGVGPGPGPNVKGPTKGVNPGNVKNPEEVNDTTLKINTDSIDAVRDSLVKIESDEKIFNSYFELAELFMYDLNKSDSAEYYLNLLLDKYKTSEKQEKVLYALASFYKNDGDTIKSVETFNKIISTYPNSLYAYEAKKVLGIKVADIDFVQNPAEGVMKDALDLFNQKKYPEAINELRSMETKYSADTLNAKAIYTIGWIYENIFSNKDSSLYYYKKLKQEFPQSVYALNVTPLLEYMASLETPKDTSLANPNDSLKGISDTLKIVNDSLKNENGELIIRQPDEEVKKSSEENKEELKIDTTGTNQENQLSPEEIEKLLKEGENSDPGK